MLKLLYDNNIRREAMRHAQHMVATSYGLGRTFWSYKGGRNNNDETAYLGKIAEIVVANYFKDSRLQIDKSPLDKEAYEHPETNFNSDFIINGHTIELKTKTINALPLGSYDIGTTRISESELYLFSRVWDERGFLFIVGWLPTSEFRARAVHRQKGSQVVNSQESSFICLSNEWVCKINQLRESQSLIRFLLNVSGAAV